MGLTGRGIASFHFGATEVALIHVVLNPLFVPMGLFSAVLILATALHLPDWVAIFFAALDVLTFLLFGASYVYFGLIHDGRPYPHPDHPLEH